MAILPDVPKRENAKVGSALIQTRALESDQHLGTLIVDRFTQLLYTTDPDEKLRIKRYLDRGLELTGAIEKVMEEERNM